ncbi:MAG: GNAT family N-acetyltransferase [Chloroflexi bacterium]|nr:GNAT family N-acetyltransferase [Chloroflexota bacterium]
MDDYEQKYILIPARLADLSQLKLIEKVCFPLDAWPLIELIGVLILPGLVKLKAEVDKKMAGFVGGDAHRGENVGWITTLGVLPQFRRFGIASALLDKCEKEMAMPTVKLTVRKSNIGAQRLYLDRGYQQFEIWKGYYEGGEDGLVLQKEL